MGWYEIPDKSVLQQQFIDLITGLNWCNVVNSSDNFLSILNRAHHLEGNV